MRFLSLFSPHNQQKPRFMAMASAVLSQADDLLSLYEEAMPSAFALDSAVGFQLDTLGALVGVSRPSSATSDDDFRVLLRARIARNHWDGTNESLPAALAAAFPDRSSSLIDNLDGTVTASLSDDHPFPLKDLFPLPAGVRLLEASDP